MRAVCVERNARGGRIIWWAEGIRKGKSSNRGLYRTVCGTNEGDNSGYKCVVRVVVEYYETSVSIRYARGVSVEVRRRWER